MYIYALHVCFAPDALKRVLDLLRLMLQEAETFQLCVGRQSCALNCSTVFPVPISLLF